MENTDPPDPSGTELLQAVRQGQRCTPLLDAVREEVTLLHAYHMSRMLYGPDAPLSVDLSHLHSEANRRLSLVLDDATAADQEEARLLREAMQGTFVPALPDLRLLQGATDALNPADTSP